MEEEHPPNATDAAAKEPFDDAITQTVEIPEPTIQAILGIANKSHRGPIPDSESFARYNEAVPGAGDRILAMAEKEQQARLAQMPLDKKREFIGRMTGQAAGFISLLTIVGLGSKIAFCATSAGQITFACALIAAPIVIGIEKCTDFFKRK